MIYKEDALKFMKKQQSGKYDLIYTDVPYNMGSEYIIDKRTGHYKFKGKGSDFMKQWEAFDGIWWDDFFKEAYRILKPGGFFITHNIDRQSDMWTYYARRNNFLPTQKLYWLFIASFAKGIDVGRIIDEHLGVERDIIGKARGAQAQSTGKYGSWGKQGESGASEFIRTKATSSLAKKYDGYKYGQAALKQVMEEIPIYWKRTNNKLAEDIVSYENGNDNIHPSVFNVGGTRIEVPKKNLSVPTKNLSEPTKWTPQLAVDEKAYLSLVKDIGNVNSSKLNETMQNIKYLEEEFNPYYFCNKASKNEREAGLEEFEPVTIDDGRQKKSDTPFQRMTYKRKNPHPSPKPLALCKWVLKLFSLPEPKQMIIFDPFVGQGSIPIAAEQLGMKWEGTEISQQYIDVVKAKLKHYKYQLF